MGLTRRELLGIGAASAIGLSGAGFAMGQTIPTPTFNFRRRPRNVIFMVVDGMAISVPTMVDHMRLIRDGRRSPWMTKVNDPGFRWGWMDTRSLSSVVTDSAAASCAWASGRNLWNGALNMYPDGTELTPICRIMSNAGVRCGLVTTTTITHATPAGFAVNSPTRDAQPLIAEMYLNAGVDVLLGGGDRFFNPDFRRDATVRDLYAEYERQGWRVVKDRDSMRAVSGQGKLLGIFSESHIPYYVDRLNNPELAAKTPTLAEMSMKAIDVLKGGRNGFFMQIEGGRVDHAGHGNDPAGLFYDQVEFEDAFEAVMNFAREDRETLVIVTSDHACGGPALNGMGSGYEASNRGMEVLANMKASYETLLPAMGSSPTPAHVQDVVKTMLGVELTTDEATAVADARRGQGPFQVSPFYRSMSATLGVVLGNHCALTWTSGNHTSDHVITTAFGPGADQMPAMIQNTSFFDMMLAAKGLRWENPRMTYEEAARARARNQAALISSIAAHHLDHEEDEECVCL